MASQEAVIEEHEGVRLNYSKKRSVFSDEIWVCVSSIVMFLITMQYIETIQRWRTCRDLVFPAIMATILWTMAIRPVVCLNWGSPDDRGYKWNENWIEQVRFITRSLVTFSATLFITIAMDEFRSFGFTLLEQFVFLAFVPIVFYGIYIFILQIVESEI
jgi:hypothetical protein